MTFEVTQRAFNTTGARLERTITVKTNGGQVTTSEFSISARTTQGAASSMVVSGTWKEDL